MAQQLSLSLSSASAQAGSVISLDLTATPLSGAIPAALQFRLTYPLSTISSVSVAASAATTAAGKSLSCANNAGWVDCIVFGLNTSAIPSGVIATAAVAVTPGIAAGNISLPLTNAVATGASSAPIPVSATAGTVTVVAAPPTTWSISGAVSSGGGATIALTGAASNTTAADSAGNYSFTGLSNGSYSVTASKSGFTISPAARAVTVSGANVVGMDFTATAIVSTWMISGTVSSGAGATIALTGAASKTTTADSAGNYSFTGLANGTYSVAASKSGFTMSPTSRAVTINGVNVAGMDFTATAIVSTWTISGTVSSGAGATVTLGGASSITTTADGTGKYAFNRLANGSYTIAPWKTGATMTPTARTVTLNGADQTTVDFSATTQVSAAPAVDRTVWTDRSQKGNSLTSPAFSTSQPNELLLAFIATDSTNGTETIKSVSGAGLSWALVKRVNTQGGTAEIWRAFAVGLISQGSVTAAISQKVAGSITVVTFTGVDTTGSNGAAAIGAVGGGTAKSGPPTASLVTTRNQSLIFAVGTDAISSVARTPVAGQSIVHQFANTNAVGTYWTQRLDAPPSAAANIIISDSAPAGSSYNLAAVEVRGPAPVGLDAISSTSRMGGQALVSDSATGSIDRRSSQAPRQTTLVNTITGEASNACTPSGWASLAGSGFTMQAPQSAAELPVPQTLGGLSVLVNGQAAPVLLVSSEQLNFQCPQLPPGTPLNIEVATKSGVIRQAEDTQMSVAAPAIFTELNTGRAIVQMADVSKTTGHARLYAIGLGETVMEVAQGAAAPLDKPVPVKNHVTVSIGGRELEPLFVGLVPGLVGVFQLDLNLATTPPADSEVFIRVDLADGTSRVSRSVTF
jgi:uncharacterized protein (TIGR03437 family)